MSGGNELRSAVKFLAELTRSKRKSKNNKQVKTPSQSKAWCPEEKEPPQKIKYLLKQKTYLADSSDHVNE